jgi:hypothetical protein
MKRYTFEQLAKRNCAECTTTITTTQQEHYLIASDIDRLKVERRERVAKIIRSHYFTGDWLDTTDRTKQEYFKMADRILDALFGEVEDIAFPCCGGVDAHSVSCPKARR